ncbi:MAG TPA: DUF6152 family protein [Vicinamibacterales bacterium]|nr:DUF6152 family protein [Vicinamibacterales bacterium]
MAAAVALVSSPAAAHHSAAAKYDASAPLTLTGTVAEFAWRNPHCFLYLDVDSGPFKGKRYVVEMSSAGVLGNAGWTRSRLAPGDVIQITVLPARAGTPAGLCRACEMRVNGVVTKAS